MVRTLEALPTAERRTKSRVRDHGPEFEVEKCAASVICLNGRPGVLVRSLRTDWLGWLPRGDVHVTKEG